MSFGRQYTVAPDIKGAGEKWHPGEILDNKKGSHRVTPPSAVRKHTPQSMSIIYNI